MAGARLPVANDVQRVTPTAPQAVQASTDAFGGQIGKAVEGFGDAAFDLSITVRDNTEKAEGNAAAAKYAEYTRMLEFGGTDPDTGEEIKGYRSMEGKEAVDNADRYSEMLTKKRDEILGGVSNHRVRRLVEPSLQSQYGTSSRSIAAGQVEGSKVYRDQSSKALQTELEQRAIANSTNWDQDEEVTMPDGTVRRENVVQDSIAAIAEEVFNREVDRVGPGAAASLAQSAASEARLKVLEDLNQRDPKRAEEYLQDILRRERENPKLSKGDLINPDAVTEFRGQLETSLRLRQSQDKVDELSTKYNGLKDAADIQAAQAEIRRDLDGEDRKAAMAQLDYVVANNKRLETMAMRDAKAEATQFILSGKSLVDLQNEKPDVMKIINQDSYFLGVLAGLPAQLDKQGEAALYLNVPTDKGTALVDDLLLPANKDKLMETNIDGLRADKLLTKKQYDKLKAGRDNLEVERSLVESGESSVFNTAEKIVTDVAQSIDRVRFSNTKAGLKKEANQKVITDLTQYIKSYIREAVAKDRPVPSEEELKKVAAKGLIAVTSDPENTGEALFIGRMPKPGEERWSGEFLFRARNTMSEQQKDNARIGADERASHNLDPIVDEMLVGEGVSEERLLEVTEDDRAALAASIYFATDDADLARIDAIIGKYK